MTLLPPFFSPPDLARHMQDSKILLCLSYSRYESLGLAVGEAGACGCVVLFEEWFSQGSFFSKMIKQRLTHSVAQGREQNLS
jgi:hypothetical protein